MLAVYDLAVSPPTYDFIAFLAAAERRRLALGDETIRFLIVRGPANGFRKDDLPPRDPAQRQAMLENIVLPMASLLPSCNGVEVVERSALDARLFGQNVFPQGYSPESPKPHYGLSVIASVANDGVFPIVVRDYVREQNLVTITLREAEYWPSRNSNLAEWLRVAEHLKASGKRVVFVRDTAKANEALPGYEIDPIASTDLMARMRLYASAELNLFTNGGPSGLAAFCLQIPMMIFKVFAPDAPCVNAEFYARNGFPEGSQFLRPGIKIVYEDDKAETVIREIGAGFSSRQKFSYVNAANVTRETIVSNMRENCKLDYPWMLPEPAHNGVAVLVGGGPSLTSNISAIKDRKRRGQKIFALNNAWRALPFAPDFVVCMDSRPENAAFFDGAPDAPTYLIASSSHPSVFKALEGKKIVVWHADQLIEEQKEILKIYDDKKAGALFGGGSTVGLRTLIVGYMIGYRRFHLYGMDSSYSGGRHHAYEQTLNDGEKGIEVFPQGFKKSYMCAPWMARQADEFQQFYKTLLKRGCFIQAHGEGLLPDLCRYINSQIHSKKTETMNA